MKLNFVALTSNYCNDKGFYHIRNSLLIIALQFFVDIELHTKRRLYQMFLLEIENY